jgi:ribonuclease HI
MEGADGALIRAFEHLELPQDIHVYTHGSALNNGGRDARAGYAVVFSDHPDRNVDGLLPGHNQTNNRAAYMAAVQALQAADEIDSAQACTLVLHTNCLLLINSMTKWLPRWKVHGWRTKAGRPVKNRDLIEELDHLSKARVIRWVHVPAQADGAEDASPHQAEAERLSRAVSGVGLR